MLNFAKTCALIYLLLKPFYLFGSGGLQVADLFLLIGSLALFMTLWVSKENRKILHASLSQNRYFIVFLLLTFFINGIYFLNSFEFKFLLSSIYYIFNLIAIVVFIIFFQHRSFIKRVGSILKINVILQLIIWGTGLGKFYDSQRYMATFNDPNQFAFFILLSFLFIYSINTSMNLKYTWVFYIVTIVLILQSGSTAMLLGIGVFSILFAILKIREQVKSPYRLVRKVMKIILILAVLAIPLTVVLIAAKDDLSLYISNATDSTSIFSRFKEKAGQASGDEEVTIIEDRGLDTIVYYPQYLLYGAGEGGYHRFTLINNYGNEIHSTLPSILFNYGILPFIIIFAWIVSKVARIDKRLFIAVLSLFVVSFFLLNQRQALFWVFLAVLPILSINLRKTSNQIGFKEI